MDSIFSKELTVAFKNLTTCSAFQAILFLLGQNDFYATRP